MENKKPKLECLKQLKMLVKSYDDWQRIRKSFCNQLKLKEVEVKTKNKKPYDIIYKDQENKENNNLDIDFSDIPVLYQHLKTACFNEYETLQAIEMILDQIPIYTEWLKGIKGISTRLASILISSYDIYKADTVSKLWSFSGYNPGMVGGYKWNNKEKCKELTNDMIRGDKLTKGYCSPFNKHLRTQLFVLADSFIKQRTMPYRQIYDDYKQRLNNQNEMLEKDKRLTKNHIHFRAIRKMNKYFLIDLYKNWRKLEGLPVREPYKDEYLNKKHNA